MPSYELKFRPSAYRAFARLDPVIKRRVAPALDALRDEPRPRGAKKLSGVDDVWRIRVGAYRIVYAIEDDRLLIMIVRIGPRGSVYRDL
ncbi:MAG TPA: type II toxin-antitoxin system RelE/ParE family toxin [Coriobacteriia bacterium]